MVVAESAVASPHLTRLPRYGPYGTMSATIDHTCYPHIIDLIWSHMDHASAVAARSVCSSWRKRANRILQRHLTVRPAPVPYTDAFLLSVVTLDEPEPEKPAGASCAYPYPSFLVEQHDVTYSGYPGHHGESGMLTTEFVGELFRNIRHLDLQYVRGTEETWHLWNLVIGLRKNYTLETTRNVLHVDGDTYPEASTAVYFVRNRDATEGNPLVSMDARHLIINLDHPPISYGALTPDDIELDDEGTIWEWLSPYNPHRLRQLTLIFHPSDEERYTFQNFAASDPRDVALRTLRWLRDSWMSRNTALVGMERFFKSVEEYWTFKRHIRELANEVAEEGGHPKRGRKLKISTHAEYRKVVGAETYTLYTEQ